MDIIVLQVVLGAPLKFPLLPLIDAADTVNQVAGFSIPDLNKHNGTILLHDEIDFTISTMVVFIEKGQALLL